MPKKIGPYRIDDEIAQGGMGVVHKAWDDVLGRWVAIKTFRRDLPIAAELRERLVREGKAQARLQHPNVVAIHTMDEHDGELFIVMEYLEGKTLEDVLGGLPDGRMALDAALRLFDQVLDALDYVHGNGIVHRDLKPLNLMVCDGRVKLMDFGIALLAGMPRLTLSPKLLGTPDYMSPEQLEGRDVDRRSDLYSAALVLYRMLSGSDAFTGSEWLAQIHARLLGAPDLRTFVPDLPLGVCNAIAKAMSHDPANRFRSAAEFRDALRDGAEGFITVPAPEPEPELVAEPEPVTPAPLEPPAPQLWIYAVALMFAAVVVAWGIWKLRQIPLPAQQPEVKRADIVYVPPPVELSTAPPPPPPVTTTKTETVVIIKEPPKETEAQRAERLNAVRTEIDAGFPAVEADIRMGDFNSAERRLDQLAAKIPAELAADLWQERDEIERLRTEVRNAEADRNRRAQQEALWESRIDDVESAINGDHFAEAQEIAKKLLRDPAIPSAVVPRLQQLQQKAKDGIRKSWEGSTVSTTTNVVRKPSSPPRK